MIDCIIVGGGAVGCAAAAMLGRHNARQGGHKRILLLEKAPRVGKKLIATGNGTCNLTNQQATIDRYHGDRRLAQPVLEAFTSTDTQAFFHSIGVDCVTRPDGKVYPASEQAGAVLDALRLEATAYGVETLCDTPVTAICPHKDGYRVETADTTYTARQVLVCTGGAASPSLGGSAEGYSLLTALGYAKTPLFPAIVQLRTATDYVRAVKGIRVEATVGLRLDGRLLTENTGEVLFTDYGLSGPAVMQISRPAGDWERRHRGSMTVSLDLLPTWERDALRTRIGERSRMPGRSLEDLLTGLLHKRVGQTVLRVAGVLPLTRSADSLTEEERDRIADTIKSWVLPVTGTQGFGGAQVTAGGIDPRDLDPYTLMSRRHPGLYMAGEMLDVDGDCGGFNLQFAWSCAFVASRAMADRW
ncbi:MAG: aminoacetone oxidase family FAD-binding enzyme [Ruminococcaceae bacterium]|nr:aminoacetone oxidase family FAD-binding enzyme [Oscillospiraceae bacterium]